ncbi:alcohol dehydrogenase catalytic domain-containing protein [Nocardioides luteus]|uniref:alcohol dehydrogenase n=1 Tax=Nocardioides luteus TaxID=1844 RepID=A0A1J4N7K1_9ACTN|nr:alcohol dehydrogenase catalytic domain-containing protein [Nocardioides luteus]OIJ27470.1 alcohol dehydrogenase [Nocardioides luteus]
MNTWPELRTVPAAMTAVTFREHGGPDVLQPEVLPVPRLGGDEVLVQVAAVAVGRLLDLAARAGTHPYAKFSFPHVLGAEHSGVVAAVGRAVTSVKVGDRVAGFPVVTCGTCRQCVAGRDELCQTLEIIGTHRPGAYAEYVSMPASNLHLVPDGLDPIEAVALALGPAVAMNQLRRAGMKAGDWVVVQAATSALGSVTAALAQHLGAHVIVTSRDEDKRKRLSGLGFTHVLDGTRPEFPDEVRSLSEGGAQVVVDNIGDPDLWRNSQLALAPGGIVVSSGAFAGHDVPVDLKRLYSLGQSVIGVRTGNRESSRLAWAEVGRGFRAPATTTFALSEAAAAHQFLEKDLNVGRVALVVGAESSDGS